MEKESLYIDNHRESRKESCLPSGIYGITASKFSKGRDNIEVATQMIRGGISVLQYREKSDKTMREKLFECRKLREITRDAGVLFIVNDHIDIAILCDADGVHLGQDDLPVKEARKLFGNKLIGVSTHSPAQAEQAVQDGADYIGVGPIFKTKTKDNVVAPVGLEYLDYAVQHIQIPLVAIGGIKLHNIDLVVSHGAKTIALVTEIVGAEDIAAMVTRLRERMMMANKLRQST